MKTKEFRFRASEELHREFRIICIENNLSFPKQMCELVRKFVEVTKSNNNFIKDISK